MVESNHQDAITPLDPMTETSNHILIKSTFENALLHLYFKVNASNSFIKEEQRNKIIIEFLKPKIKESQYNPIKKKLKTVCLMKNKFGSIEKHLDEILSNYSSVTSKNDVDKLYSVLESFEAEGLDTKLLEETPTQEFDIVYLDRQHIDDNFDVQNRQIAPISLFIKTNNLNRFLKCLTEQIYFKFELYEGTEDINYYHYQLTPMS